MLTHPPPPPQDEPAYRTESDELRDANHTCSQPEPPRRHWLATTTIRLSMVALALCVFSIVIALVFSGKPIPKMGEKGSAHVMLIGLMFYGSVACALGGGITAVIAIVQMSRASSRFAGKLSALAGGIISALVGVWWVAFFFVLSPMAQTDARRRVELFNLRQVSIAMLHYTDGNQGRNPPHPILLKNYLSGHFEELMAGAIEPQSVFVETSAEALHPDMRDLLTMKPTDVEFGAFRFGGYWFTVQPARYSEMRSPSAHIVAFSRRFRSNQDWRALAFADTSARWVREEEFRGILKSINDERVRHLKLKPIEPDDLGPEN